MTGNISQKAANLLKSVNLRRTTARIAVLAVLLKASKPVTQEQVAVKLGADMPNKVTIYRTLKRLLDAGLVHKAFIQKRTWHFELAHNCTEKQCHPHFTCIRCGATQCLMGLSTSIISGLKKGFIVHRQQVRLEGLCPGCS